jgi:hypothetical protein
MKIYIGKYKDWINLHTFENFLKQMGVSNEVVEWIDDSIFNSWVGELLTRFNEWRMSKGNQRTYIKLDPWDTWSLDCTLASIIIPLLTQLKNTTHVYPYSEDIQDEDDWDEILGKMIWSFQEIVDDNWEAQYILEWPEIDSDDLFDKKADEKTWGVSIPGEPNEPALELKWKKRGVYDLEGMQKHQERIQDGINLFAKYYFNLRD